MTDLTTAFGGKYLSLTSYRRDGTAVATPVWFVQEGGRLLVQTDAGSGKVKRIRADPEVSVAPCNGTGHLRGDQVPARAELLAGAEVAHVEELLRHKYRRDMLVIGPLRWAQRTFHLGKDRGPTVALSITFGPAGAGAEPGEGDVAEGAAGGSKGDDRG
ncbi:MAG TPA: PPOX class F420-dependent oxidoreductase [Acidimicrobiales bacterium]|nr:PPOX class F420-dependent oxidoreductase [Acidimicrobiales bacterium]